MGAALSFFVGPAIELVTGALKGIGQLAEKGGKVLENAGQNLTTLAQPQDILPHSFAAKTGHIDDDGSGDDDSDDGGIDKTHHKKKNGLFEDDEFYPANHKKQFGAMEGEEFDVNLHENSQYAAAEKTTRTKGGI